MWSFVARSNVFAARQPAAATIDMTMRYAHLSPDRRREAFGGSIVPLLLHATYVQHMWRKSLTIRKDAVIKRRRRESNP